jgi:rhodanese-related sulfurtransferase
MFSIFKKIFGTSSAVDFKELALRGAVIVDVRTAAEFKTGHIQGAINIPLDQVKSKMAELKKANKPIITCCRSGSRSGMAKSMIHAAGMVCYNGGPWNLLQSKIRS